jgi:hypothetical protein
MLLPHSKDITDRDGTSRISTFLHTVHHKAKIKRKLWYSAFNLVTPEKSLD